MDSLKNNNIDELEKTYPEKTYPEKTYCANHPTVETLLRCNRCGKLICMKCSQLTDVGYRCTDCIRGVQDSYFNAEGRDNPIAFIISFMIAAIVSPIVGLFLGRFGIWGLFIAFMIGSGAGSLLAQIIRAAIGRRRGRYLPHFAISGIILGALVGILIAPFSFLSIGIFVFLAATTAYGFLR